MKKFAAILAALLITVCIGLAMFALGANALLNPNGAAFASAPGNSNTTTSGSNVNSALASDPNAAQVKQLQDLVAQYQQREKQYRDQLNQARQQLGQASQQIQQYQNLLEALQQAGIIQIQGEQIFIPRGFGDHD